VVHLVLGASRVKAKRSRTAPVAFRKVQDRVEGCIPEPESCRSNNNPYIPRIPGQEEWLCGNADREIVHSIKYDNAASFAGRSVLVVRGRASGVDMCRELMGVAGWVYRVMCIQEPS